MVDVNSFDQLAKELKKDINKYVQGSTDVTCTKCGSAIKIKPPLKTIIECEVCGNKMNPQYILK